MKTAYVEKLMNGRVRQVCFTDSSFEMAFFEVPGQEKISDEQCIIEAIKKRKQYERDAE